MEKIIFLVSLPFIFIIFATGRLSIVIYSVLGFIAGYFLAPPALAVLSLAFAILLTVLYVVSSIIKIDSGDGLGDPRPCIQMTVFLGLLPFLAIAWLTIYLIK